MGHNMQQVLGTIQTTTGGFVGRDVSTNASKRCLHAVMNVKHKKKKEIKKEKSIMSLYTSQKKNLGIKIKSTTIL